MSLQFDSVSHRYGAETALRGVSLVAEAGRITCLLGASGSGKSTVLRLAAGLERLQAGSIHLDREVLSEPGNEPSPERRPVGLVFQDHVLFPHKTVLQNIAFGLRDLAPSERRAVAEQALANVSLHGFAGRYPETLSGGQQQRVALARALAPLPRVMLLDEPFANVDATLRRALREDTRRALRSAGSVAVIVTHDPDEALELADRIVVLEAGSVVQAGTPVEIWRQPASAAVAKMFGQAQELRGSVENGVVTTPFGTFEYDPQAGPELPNHGDVDVLIRPTAVTLRKATDGARLDDIRFLGDRALALARVGDDVLRASLDELGELEVGDHVAAAFDSRGIFVYPSVTVANS